MKKPRRDKGHQQPGHQQPVQAQEPSPMEGAGNLAPWLLWPSYMWSGWLRWVEASLQMWQTSLDGERRGVLRFEPIGDAQEARRQVPAGPWLPSLEATVIPLRRRTDPPGSEATRISMRFMVPSLPWDGVGAKIISVDALLARRESAAATRPVEDAQAPLLPKEEE